MKPNHILVLATTFPRDDTRVTHPVYDLARETMNKNDNTSITVLAPHHPGSKKQEMMSGIEVRRYPYFFPRSLQQLCYEGGIFESIQRNPLLAIQLPLLFISLLFYTIKVVIQEEVDLIHSHWLLPSGVAGAITSKVMRTHHVLTLHAGGVLGLRKLPLNTRVASFVYRNTDFISPVSSHLQQQFTTMLPSSVDISYDDFEVQPMCADPKHYKNHTKSDLREDMGIEDHTVGLFVGNFVRTKGIENLVQAIEELDVGSNFKMYLVGKGPLFSDIEKMVKNSKYSSNIELTGFVSKSKLNKLYVCADFVVVPSIVDDAGNTEGMPTVISEAFVSGTPVIASDVGGVSDVVVNGQNGYLTQQKDPQDLADKIQKIILCTEKRKELTSSAEESGKQLTWSYCADKYMDIYRSVCQTS